MFLLVLALLLLSCRAAPAEPLVLTIRSEQELEVAQERLRELGYQEDEPPPVKILLEAVPGDLGDRLWPHPLQIEVDGGGSVLPFDRPLLVAGAQVTVRDLGHSGGSTPQALLRIEATERVFLEDLHFKGAPASGQAVRGAYLLGTALQIDAYGPAVEVEAARVEVRDARGSPSVALLAADGGFGKVIWREGRFIGGLAPEIYVENARSFSAPGTIRSAPPVGTRPASGSSRGGPGPPP